MNYRSKSWAPIKLIIQHPIAVNNTVAYLMAALQTLVGAENIAHEPNSKVKSCLDILYRSATIQYGHSLFITPFMLIAS